MPVLWWLWWPVAHWHLLQAECECPTEFSQLLKGMEGWGAGGRVNGAVAAAARMAFVHTPAGKMMCNALMSHSSCIASRYTSACTACIG
jgi:hypothetical protein